MLTQFAITNAKPKAKPYKLADQGGLYLLVKPTGMRLWRFRYRFAGKENTLGFGSFPTVPLAEARGKRDEARKQVAAGIDPSQQKKLERVGITTAAQNTFKVIAAELLKKAEDEGAAEATMTKNRWLLEDLAASLATRPITQIKPVEVLNLLRRIERTGRRETAHRLRGAIGGVFRFAIITSRAETDPTAALRGALLRPQTQHRASITDEQALGALMRSIDEYDGWPTLTTALGLLALTMTRPGDVRHAKRPEFDLEAAVSQLGDQPAQREVAAPATFHQPLAMATDDLPRPMATHPRCRRASRRAEALNPDDRRLDAYAKPLGRLSSRQAFLLNRPNSPVAQIN